MYYKIINRKKRAVTRALDILGYLLSAPFRLFGKKGGISGVSEILVIRTAYIGDVIMTLPVLKPLKDLYPGARITFLTAEKAKDVLAGNPYVDEVLAYDAFWFYPAPRAAAIRRYLGFLKELRKVRYDLVIEARADIRDIALLARMAKARHRVSYNVGGGGYLLTHVVPYRELKHKVEYHLDIVRFLGAKDPGLHWGIHLNEGEEKRALELLRRKGARLDNLVAIHPGSRKELKCWSYRGFAEVADRLMDEHGAAVVFTGSPDEAPLVDRVMGAMRNRPVSLAGQTGLREMAAIIKRCRLFVCNDTSPLHIAAAAGTPTVAIFGPSKSMETGPYGGMHRVVEKDFACRYSCDEDVCLSEAHNECMDAIKADDVMRAAEDILNRRV
ncbi:MAG: putative lipopolysaccharide heptosyltransferase III [Deltaproteobacteria bacterium]|nr:putative lipopolysaccharide heptosyltransferase III [Deltaproteobacteria bacterium]